MANWSNLTHQAAGYRTRCIGHLRFLVSCNHQAVTPAIPTGERCVTPGQFGRYCTLSNLTLILRGFYAVSRVFLSR